MVRVPVSPGRSVQVQRLDPRPLRYAEARNFVAPAMERFGEQIGEAAQAWDSIEAGHDQADVLAADNAHAAFLSEKGSEFSTLKGGEPERLRKDYLQQLDRNQTELLTAARSDRARKMLKQVLDNRTLLAKKQITEHADREMFVYRGKELKAGRDQAVLDAIGAEDEERFGVAVGVGLLRIEELGTLSGTPEAALGMERHAFLDDVHRGRVDRLFAVPDPDIETVKDYYSRFRSQMTPALQNEILERLQGPIQARVANSDADALMGFAPAPIPSGEGVATPIALALPKGAPGEVGGELQSAGYSPAVVAGFLGNFHVEGGYGGAQGDGGSASGIAQWRGERRANFRRQFGKEPHQATPQEQARFVLWEMKNPTQAGMTVAQRDAILNAGSASEAAALIDQHYERSSGQHREERKAAAERLGGSGYASSAREWDRSQIYANLEALADREGWNPERKERARKEVDRRIQQDEGLLRERRQDADEQVTRVTEAMGRSFVKVEQIPRAIWNSLSPADQAAWRKVAEANAKPVEPDANGARVMELNLMRFYEPERFKALNLGHDAGSVTRAELDTLLTTQASMRTSEGKWSPRAGITTALSYGAKIHQMDLGKEDQASILKLMEAEAWRRYEASGKKPLTDNDYQELFRSATRTVKTTTSILGIPTGSKERRRYELTESMMPHSTRARLESLLRKAGLPVTDEAILRLYRLEQ